MAERTAHIASASSVSSAPSIFDVLAQESLMSGFRPAMKYLAKYLSSTFPGKCGIVYRWFDEVYAALELILENYYLKQYSASFSENFYGMKRVSPGDGKYLAGSKRIRSLILLVVAPYVKLKFDRFHEKLKAKWKRQGSENKTKVNKLVSAFITAYPIISAGLEIWTLVLQVAYIVSRSSVHSPWLLFAGVRLANLTSEDVAHFGEVKPELPKDGSIVQRLYYIFRLFIQLSFRVLSRLLGVGLFFLQFLDWWFSSDEAANPRSLSTLPKPPPPQLVCVENQIVKLNPKLCPICKKTRKNDTVLAASGYVFCYGCIFRHLQSNRCCPVTNLPAGPEHLIRLFAETRQKGS